MIHRAGRPTHLGAWASHAHQRARSGDDGPAYAGRRPSLSATVSGGGDSSLSSTPNPFLFASSGLVTGVLILMAFVAEAMTPTPFIPFSNANFVASQTDLALWSFRSFAWGLFAIGTPTPRRWRRYCWWSAPHCTSSGEFCRTRPWPQQAHSPRLPRRKPGIK